MSMNLSCVIDGYEVDLYQTPTHMSDMCMAQDDGSTPWELTGDKAKGAMFRYLCYKQEQDQGWFNHYQPPTKEEQDAKGEDYHALLCKTAELRNRIVNAKTIEVWIS